MLILHLKYEHFLNFSIIYFIRNVREKRLKKILAIIYDTPLLQQDISGVTGIYQIVIQSIRQYDN